MRLRPWSLARPAAALALIVVSLLDVHGLLLGLGLAGDGEEIVGALGAAQQRGRLGVLHGGALAVLGAGDHVVGGVLAARDQLVIRRYGRVAAVAKILAG